MTTDAAADPDALIDTACELALDIARSCPDCAEKARQLVSLVGQLRPSPLDRSAVQDAIDCETTGSDLSEAQVHATTERVLRVARGEDPA